MYILESFIRDNFETLSKKEKAIAIKQLISSLCKSLDLDDIPVKFSNLTTDEGKDVGGKLIYSPLHIVINEKFISNEKIKALSNEEIDYDVLKSYFLVNTIAHECYHYLQFVLEKKLINGDDLKEQDKEKAYLYFVCLHDELFSGYLDKIGIKSPITISNDNLYLYSPVELGAEGFAYEITKILGTYDKKENYAQYTDIHSFNYLKKIEKNAKSGGDLIAKSINHSLQSAIDFLNYKNQSSNSSKPYLGIDTLELEEQVLKASKAWKEKEKKEIEVYNKIVKNR